MAPIVRVTRREFLGDRQGRTFADVLDDPEQRGELGAGAGEVVGGQQPQGDHLDADLFAPAQERLDVGGTGPVPLGGVVFLVKAEENSVRPRTPEECAADLFRAFLIDRSNPGAVEKVCRMAERLLDRTPIWLFANRGDYASPVVLHDALEATFAAYERYEGGDVKGGGSDSDESHRPYAGIKP